MKQLKKDRLRVLMDRQSTYFQTHKLISRVLNQRDLRFEEGRANFHDVLNKVNRKMHYNRDAVHHTLG